MENGVDFQDKFLENHLVVNLVIACIFDIRLFMFLINVPLILQGKTKYLRLFFGGDVFSIMKMSFGLENIPLCSIICSRTVHLIIFKNILIP